MNCHLFEGSTQAGQELHARLTHVDPAPQHRFCLSRNLRFDTFQRDNVWQEHQH